MRLVIAIACGLLAGCELFVDVPTGTLAPTDDAPGVGCIGGCSAPTPVCVTDTGTCVECITNPDCTDPMHPACDHNACRACRFDAECASAVCLDDGTCADAARVLYTTPAGTSATCAQGDPCTIDTAVALVTAAHDIIHLDGTYVREAGVALTAKTHLAGDTAVLQIAPTAPNFTSLLSADTFELSIRGLSFELGTSGEGVNCTNGKLTMTNTRFSGGAIAGFASPCQVTMDRVTIQGGAFYGFLVNGGPLAITNSFITDNGTGGTSSGGLFLQTVTAGRVEHTTFTRNSASTMGAKAIRCTTSGGVIFRSNIIYGNASPAIDNVCNVGYSVIDPGYTGPGTLNTIMDPQFMDPTTRNYHLMTTSPVLEMADPASTITHDFDGDSRPNPTGTRADPGADEI